MGESILAILGLGLIAGGSIVVIDWLVIRRIRRLAADERHAAAAERRHAENGDERPAGAGT
ncbi:MAG TPA: hypothetical protein VM305_03575 [Candidatus Limnocylindrales bacterium]|nr:hypothetical protein [Candidatus Limnocylindrales bacterium]